MDDVEDGGTIFVICDMMVIEFSEEGGTTIMDAIMDYLLKEAHQLIHQPHGRCGRILRERWGFEPFSSIKRMVLEDPYSTVKSNSSGVRLCVLPSTLYSSMAIGPTSLRSTRPLSPHVYLPYR